MPATPRWIGLCLSVRDLDAALGFYALLGLTIERVCDVFGRTIVPNGATIESMTAELTRSYGPNWMRTATTSGCSAPEMARRSGAPLFDWTGG